MKGLNTIKGGVIAISLGSVVLGGIGILVRIANSSIEPMAQSFGRIFATFILITLFNAVRGDLKKGIVEIKKRHVFLFFLNGIIGFSLLAPAFTLSVIHTGITNAYFLLYTAPIFAAIISVVALKEKLSKKIIISILLSFLGLVFIFNPTNPLENITGNIYGLITGLGFGAYFVITGYLRKYYSASTLTFWTQFFGSLGLFPLAFIFDKASLFSYPVSSWIPVGLAGLVVFTGYMLLNFGLKKVSPSTGSLLSLFEPLSAIFYGAIIFSEKPSGAILVGATLIIASIINLTRKQKG